jgi:hypothetical protein
MSYVRARNWIDLGDWGKGMDEFKLPASHELSGKQLEFHFNERNLVIRHTFHDAGSLTWKVLKGPETGRSGTETYEAIRVAHGVYFVDYVKKAEPGVSWSMALDLNTPAATILIATVPDKNRIGRRFIDRLGQGLDLSTVKLEILHASINPGPGRKTTSPHKRTADLVGKRAKYTYSRNHIYEHIYLNENFFTWHCLEGVEKGLADTEICDYFKIAEDIYFFTWREKVMPTFGAVLINFKEMRSNGKTFGLDVSSGKIINFTMGSLAEPINEIHYP